MPCEDQVASPAVCDCPAVAEIAEFARRAPQMNFAPAYRRAVVAALLRAAGEVRGAAPLLKEFSPAPDSHTRMPR